MLKLSYIILDSNLILIKVWIIKIKFSKILTLCINIYFHFFKNKFKNLSSI